MKCVACYEEALPGDNMCLMHKQAVEHDVFDSEEPWLCPDCGSRLAYDVTGSVLCCEYCREAWDRKLIVRLSEKVKGKVKL